MIREVDLISYLPDYIKKYKELATVLSAANEEIRNVRIEAERILNNRFIETADKAGIVRFEQLMGIDSYGSLEERRFRCKSKWNEQKNYTFGWLQEQLSYLCGADGYKIELTAEKYQLFIQVALKSKHNVTAIMDMLDRTVPANLIWEVSLLYNQYITLRPYTHRQLSKYSYRQLRNEVLENA